MFSFFIVVQGPYVEGTANLITCLRKIFPDTQIILSCYKEKIDKCVFETAEVRRNEDPGTIITPPRNKPLNLKRQATTTLMGCRNATQPWVMKFRSDLEIVSEKKILQSFNLFVSLIERGEKLRLMTLNTGCLNIFSYYQMPFHFNDIFFVTRTSELRRNCEAAVRFNEQKLVDDFSVNIPENYYHRDRYQLKFHCEQIMHFGAQLISGHLLKYCCDMNHISKMRHMLWTAKYLHLTNMKAIGIRSTKAGYPSINSHLVSIDRLCLALLKQVAKNNGRKRNIAMLSLVAQGLVTKYIFLANRTIFRLIVDLKKLIKKNSLSKSV